MAWYPGATRMELQPESDSQSAIRPTQLIMHSIAAPWDEQRIYEYWRDSTNLESHFGLDYDGSLGQFIGTETRADANYRANLRLDGTGAISIETASNLKHTDPWTAAQVEELIQLGVWVHQTHGIPLQICRAPDDPGFGYHRMYADWSSGGTDCPGDARAAQFHNIIFPGIVARAANPNPPASEEDDLMSSMLNKHNDIDVNLTADGDYTGLAMTKTGTSPAVIHGPGVSHSTSVRLLFDPATISPTTRFKGRFFHAPVTWSGDPAQKSLMLPASGVPGEDCQVFTADGDVPAGQTLRFELYVSEDVTLLHRQATGPYKTL